MKSALLVLALAVLSSVGCRAMSPDCGSPCCDSGGSCKQSCHMAIRQNAPRPGGCAEGCAPGSCSRGGDIEGSCPGGEGCVFDRYQGSECGPGYPNAQYDCSPCCSPNWGANGYRHPNGYTDNSVRVCGNGQCGGQPNQQCSHCGRAYCGTGPAPGCSCCPFCGCGPSGDQNYNFNPGPPVAQTAYPYYTLRGPRDFLLAKPPSIGPY